MFKRYKREFALLLDFSKGIGRYEVGDSVENHFGNNRK